MASKLRATSAPSSTTRREICLRGQPPLRHYLDFVKHQVIDGDKIAPKLLSDEWREANDYYHELETREAGAADTAECRALTGAQARLTRKIEKDARYRNTFDKMPTEFGMVELDKLVLFQTRVDEEHVRALAGLLKGKQDFGALVEFCFPTVMPEVPINIERVGSRRFTFSSVSTDMRYQNPILLTQTQMRGVESAGPIVGLAGVPVGFGSNLFSVIRSGTRMLLHNGYHRACAMRLAGVTHVPCIIQTVTRQDELDVAAKAEVAEKTEFYFRTARPPLLKDFFDPRIRRVFTVRRMKRVIEVNFDVREFTLPA